MAVFKRERCPGCGYMHNEPRPRKVNKDCPKCGRRMVYLPSWYISYQIHGRKYVEAAGAQKSFARDALSKRRVELREGKFFDKLPDVTWDRAAAAFTAWLDNAPLSVKGKPMDPDTIRMYKNSLNNLGKFFGGRLVSQINNEPELLEEYMRLKLSEGKSHASVNRDVSTIKRLFSMGTRKDLGFKIVHINKLDAVRKLREEARIRYLHDYEVDALLEACRPLDYLYVAVLCAIDTGLRRDGALTLRWPEVDFQQALIRKAVKGGKVVMVPLTARLRDALLDFKAARKILSEYVIPSPRDPRKPFSNPRKGFVRALKTAGLKNFRWHDLRHTFATHFLRRTGDLRALQEILGHSSITQTEKYAHVLDEHRREAMAKYERGWTSNPIGSL